MQIQYGRSPIGGNLGDELNLWLWPQIFGDNVFKRDDDVQFLGIGSILSSDPVYNSTWIDKNKIVFGTGIRPGSSFLKIDSSYDIMFLRGPLSNYSLGGNFGFITDSAYCLQFVPIYKSLMSIKKTHKIGLMPYFRSDGLLHWNDIADELGMHYISPICESFDITKVLKEIASCDFLITEAMHGAIIADILRIPWARFVLTTYKCEGSNVADFKWMDWMYSLNIPAKDYPVIRLTNKINHAITRFSNAKLQLNTIFKHSLKRRIIERLNSTNIQYALSDISHFNRAKNQLEEKIDMFKIKHLK